MVSDPNLFLEPIRSLRPLGPKLSGSKRDDAEDGDSENNKTFTAGR